MDRPSRKTKTVNYNESKDFVDHDDEDFAYTKSPPSKKVKETVKNQDNRKSSKSSSQDTNSQSVPSQKNRQPFDVKLFERDLEAAISLSMLNSSFEISDQPPASKEDVIQNQVDENTDPSSAHLSNCIVDVTRLGLDRITTEQDFPAPTRHKKESANVQIKLKNQDVDYQPNAATDSESDNDYSEPESEDEEFTVKKAIKTKKEKVAKKGKQPQSTKNEQQPRNSKSAVASTPTRTPLTIKNAPGPTKSTPSSKTSITKPATSLSPAVNKISKWNPPGQIGRSPSSSQSPSVRSPGQGLRLGLSRLVRVKPLHPSVASH